MILNRDFYESINILEISKSLLGKKLCTNIEGNYCSGYIVETEAYKAPEDKASHAYMNKLTPRTATMFSQAGTAYVYIIYGTFHLFNIITAPEGIPHCILIRAVQPIEGVDIMIGRRGIMSPAHKLTNGPGKFSIAMGINKNLNGTDLTVRDGIWLEEGLPQCKADEIVIGPRVGMSTAGESSNWPFRFRIKDNQWTSKPDKVWYEGF